ncbi:MAG: HIRAN domain-containing protein [Thermodesulfobacteriota bacterium]
MKKAFKMLSILLYLVLFIVLFFGTSSFLWALCLSVLIYVPIWIGVRLLLVRYGLIARGWDPAEVDFPTSPDAKIVLRPFRGDSGRGYVFERAEGGKRLPWRRLRWEDGMKSIPVVGERHHKGALKSDGFNLGSEVALKPEPDNPYDPNAVSVWDKNETPRVGYLPANDHVKEGILKRLEKGEDLRAFVIWEDQDGRSRTGIRLLVLTADAKLGVE